MKTLIFKVLFILILIFGSSESQQIPTIIAFDLVKEIYGYAQGCIVTHNVVFKSGMEVASVGSYSSAGSITKTSNLKSEEVVDGIYYYYYQLESVVIATDPLFHVMVNDVSGSPVLTSTSYVCEVPPTSLQFPPVYISTPIKIINTFYLKNDNLKKPLEYLVVTPTESNYPFNLKYVSSDKGVLVFNLEFTQSYIYKQTASFQCNYSASNSFALVITLPVKPQSLTQFQQGSTTYSYPLNAVYNTSNNWDIRRLVDFKYSNYDSNFIFGTVDYYTPTLLDTNQFYQIVSGNQLSGRLLLSYSFYSLNRGLSSGSSVVSSKIYDVSLYQLFSQTSVNQIITSAFSVYPLSNINIGSYYLYSSEFDINYPFDFNFAVNLGNTKFYVPQYPYGITTKKSNSKLTKYQFSSLVSKKSAYSYQLVSDLGDKSQQTSNGVLDTVLPELIEFSLNYLRDGSGRYALLRIRVTDDSSGFSFLYYGGNYITFTDLLPGGSVLDGYYEKTIIVNFDTTCYYQDLAGNKAFCQNSVNPALNYYFKLSPLLITPTIINNNPLNITLFNFEQTNSYDLTSEGKLVTIQFNYRDSSYDIPIQFYLLDRVYGDKYINFDDYSNGYYWINQEKGYFEVTFSIPSKLCFGTLPYLFIINGKRYQNEYFYSIFGDSSLLKIVSTDCYEYPPIISSISYLSSTSSSQPYYQTTKLGWTITVQSGVNFKYFEFHVVSDLDPLGYYFSFDYSDRQVSLDTFDISFDFNPLVSPTQTFKLYNITLVDERGIKSQLLFDRDIDYLLQNANDKYPPPISPLFKISDPTITSFVAQSTTFILENGLPQLDSLNCTVSSLDVGATDNERVLTFSFSTSDTVAISRRHIPSLYLEAYTSYGGFEDQKVKCLTQLPIYSDGDTKASYTAVCQVPYGFGGAMYYISVSLFGIVDTSLNIAGYSTQQLKNINYLNSIPVVFSRNPIIKSWTPLKEYQTTLTIYGKNLAIDPKNTQVFITYTNEDIDNQRALGILLLSNVGLVLSLPASIQSFVIFVQTNNIKSNQVIITYGASGSLSSTSSSSGPIIPIVKCLGNPECGGSSRGKCIKDIGCRCIPPYSGLDCLSETLKIPKPSINETSPDIENEFNLINSTNKDIKLNTIISIIAIRELDIDGKEVNKHIFSEWDYRSLSESSYLYSSTISKLNQNVSTVEIKMDWYGEESGNITFANQTISINPFSLKYYINVQKYPFNNKFCTLELVIKSTFKSNQNDVCSSKQFSLNDETDYISLQIGKYTFEGKFIKRGIIDNKSRVIDNRLLDSFDYGQANVETSTSNKQLSFIAIQIPYYEESIQLDPNFGVLVNPNSASSNSNDSICNSSKKKLTTAQIIGIVIGGVMFIVIVSIILYIRFSKSSTFMNIKIFIYNKKKSFNNNNR